MKCFFCINFVKKINEILKKKIFLKIKILDMFGD